MGDHVCAPCARWLQEAIDGSKLSTTPDQDVYRWSVNNAPRREELSKIRPLGPLGHGPDHLPGDEVRYQKRVPLVRRRAEVAASRSVCYLCDKIESLHLRSSREEPSGGASPDRNVDDQLDRIYLEARFVVECEEPSEQSGLVKPEVSSPSTSDSKLPKIDQLRLRVGDYNAFFRPSLKLPPLLDVITIHTDDDSNPLPETASSPTEALAIDTYREGHEASYKPYAYFGGCGLEERRVYQICSWLQACQSSHPACQAMRSRGLRRAYVPKRLIKLSTEDAPPRLVELTDHQSAVKYATLSHCWGKASFLKLTADNHAALKKHMSADQLPRTFREAIQLCRMLHIGYLWIDSLCIIQQGDDQTDWLDQAPQMDRVYGNSTLNIAASASEDGDQGLFRPYGWSVGRRLAIRHRDCLLVEGSSRIPHHRRDVFEAAPLHRRGWVLQELFLAPNTLHFFHNEMAWQCKSGLFSESDLAHTHFAYNDPPPLAFPFSVFDEASEGALDYLWIKIIHAYSGMQLTYTSDALAALSGVARAYEEAYLRCFDRRDADTLLEFQLPDEKSNSPGKYSSVDTTKEVNKAPTKYLYGCWYQSLTKWLLWGIETEAPTDNFLPDEGYSRQHLVPSWSWLSCSRKVRFSSYEALYGDVRALATASLQDLPEEISPFTPCARLPHKAALDIRCPGFAIDSGQCDLTFQGDHRGELPSGDILHTFQFSVDFDDGTCCTGPPFGQELHFAFLYTFAVHNNHFHKGLVLKRSAEEGVFRRVGRFRSVRTIPTKYLAVEQVEDALLQSSAVFSVV